MYTFLSTFRLNVWRQCLYSQYEVRSEETGRGGRERISTQTPYRLTLVNVSKKLSNTKTLAYFEPSKTCLHNNLLDILIHLQIQTIHKVYSLLIHASLMKSLARRFPTELKGEIGYIPPSVMVVIRGEYLQQVALSDLKLLLRQSLGVYYQILG